VDVRVAALKMALDCKNREFEEVKKTLHLEQNSPAKFTPTKDQQEATFRKLLSSKLKIRDEENQAAIKTAIYSATRELKGAHKAEMDTLRIKLEGAHKTDIRKALLQRRIEHESRLQSAIRANEVEITGGDPSLIETLKELRAHLTATQARWLKQLGAKYLTEKVIRPRFSCWKYATSEARWNAVNPISRLSVLRYNLERMEVRQLWRLWVASLCALREQEEAALQSRQLTSAHTALQASSCRQIHLLLRQRQWRDVCAGWAAWQRLLAEARSAQARWELEGAKLQVHFKRESLTHPPTHPPTHLPTPPVLPQHTLAARPPAHPSRRQYEGASPPPHTCSLYCV
jgi:hypothetical protein